ncbi:MAG TPA: hypothetical protein PLW54_03260 [Bacteroidia bacterium]|nr:hypothetical protein [Bacteroidia bacterium]
MGEGNDQERCALPRSPAVPLSARRRINAADPLEPSISIHHSPLRSSGMAADLHRGYGTALFLHLNLAPDGSLATP